MKRSMRQRVKDTIYRLGVKLGIKKAQPRRSALPYRLTEKDLIEAALERDRAMYDDLTYKGHRPIIETRRSMIEASYKTSRERGG
jgi:hypothetical protein